MDFSQIRYFLALADTLNFTRAAERCNVTQPTLTQAIKRLEDELGGPLVLRDGRNTRLSELGKALRKHFEKIDETKKALKDTATAITAGDDVELNIGLMCTIGPRILSPFLDHFRRDCPHAKIMLHDVTPGAIPNLLLTGAIDGAVCARHAAKHDRLDYVPLFREAMVVAFPQGHAFEQLERVSVIDLPSERYLDRLHCEFRDDFNALCAKDGIMLETVFTSEREDWIQNMIAEGLGVSVIPEYSLVTPAIGARPMVEPLFERNVEFATVYGGFKGPGLRALIAAIKTYPWHDLIEERVPVLRPSSMSR